MEVNLGSLGVPARHGGTDSEGVCEHEAGDSAEKTGTWVSVVL